MKTLTKKYQVAKNQTARSMGSGDLEVLATPALVAMMENCAKSLVADGLSVGQTTVGFKLDLKHLAPSPIGAEIKVEAELTDVDGQKLSFSIKAYDQATLIGNASHQRVIVETADFLEKLKQKHNM